MRIIHASLLALLTLCMFNAPAAAKPSVQWVTQMDALAVVLTTLLTDASAVTLDDEGRARVKRNVAALKELSHGLSMSARPDSDPTIPVLLRELDMAIDDVGRAHPDRLADTALAVAWTCLGCHTRTDVGAGRSSAAVAALAPIDSALAPDVRGTALAATRRFAEARKAFRSAAFDETFARTQPMRWQRSVKGAILLDLRLNHDARGALEVVDRVLATPDGEPMWADAAAWRKVLVPMAKSKTPWPRTLPALAAEAERLISQADARGPGDAGAEILLLRATAVVHELLMRNPPKDMYAQSLAWLGQSYRGLKDLDIWSLHLIYDAACIEAAPHSPLAASCYKRWLDGARAAFTGNGGGALPDALATRDHHLRALAAP